MRLVPSESICHASYLLAYCAALDDSPTTDELIARCHRLPAGHCYYRDLKSLLAAFVDHGVVIEEGGRLAFAPSFPSCRSGATRDTKLRIALFLLRWSRPDWLCVGGDLDKTIAALMPIADRTALEWMGEDLNPILAAVSADVQAEDVEGSLGRIGEEIVVQSEFTAGHFVRQVSQISDAYGYDIESKDWATGTTRFIEVKCTVRSRAGEFFLTRHEFERAAQLGTRWTLLQVILAPQIWTSPILDGSLIQDMRDISAPLLVEQVITDTERCRWEGAVLLHLPAAFWSAYAHRPSDDWRVPNSIQRGMRSGRKRAIRPTDNGVVR